MATPHAKPTATGQRAWPLPQLGRKTLLVLGVGLVLLALYPFLGAIAVAAVFAFGTYPYVKKLVDRVGRKRPRLTVGLCVLVLSLSLLLPVTFLSLRLYNLATAKGEDGAGLFSSQTISKMSAAKGKIENTAVAYGVKAGIFRSEKEALDSVHSGTTKALNGALALIPATIASVPSLFLTVLVFCLFLYLFLSRARQIHDSVIRLGIIPSAQVQPITRTLQSSCYTSLVSNLIIGVIQASVVAIGARIGGYSEVVLVFSTVFVLSFIPFIGSSPIAFVLAGLSLLNHNNSSAIILVVTGVISGTIDNVIRPYLVAKGENNVSPIVSFAVIIGAIAILGIKGIFLGPVIITTTVGLLNMRVPEEAAVRERKAS